MLLKFPDMALPAVETGFGMPYLVPYASPRTPPTKLLFPRTLPPLPELPRLAEVLVFDVVVGMVPFS